MALTITYPDKSAAVTSGYPDNQSITADDLNEIKTVVNEHATDIDNVESDIASLESDISEQQTGDAYVPQGWAYYRDSETSPATQTITTTPSILQIDGSGASSESGYLPLAINGVSELWNTNLINPISLGDSYDLRIDLEISAKSGTPNSVDLVLDIGGAAGITIPVVSRTINTSKTAPFDISVGFPIFCLSTFLSNGGQIFLSTDTGTVTIAGRGIFIKRDFSGDLIP